jgi:predicted ester cyclase
LNIINDICTEEVISCTPLGEPQRHEALKEHEIPVHEAFLDFEVTFENLVAKDDCVAMRLMFLDTHEIKTMGPLEHS